MLWHVLYIYLKTLNMVWIVFYYSCFHKSQLFLLSFFNLLLNGAKIYCSGFFHSNITSLAHRIYLSILLLPHLHLELVTSRFFFLNSLLYIEWAQKYPCKTMRILLWKRSNFSNWWIFIFHPIFLLCHLQFPKPLCFYKKMRIMNLMILVCKISEFVILFVR